ncbi:SDR family oxidoreductase [Vibrio parahaemolyticus]|nr:SDR family oxidoreductase [Vibrio parahaemolyticus]
MNILIVGGNGGIGLAMVKEALVRFPLAQIHATYWRTTPDYEHSALIWHQVDVTDETQVKNLSQVVNSIDWVINCVGMLHTPNKSPEKNLSMVEPDFFLQNIAVNTLPSMLLAKYFTPLLKRSGAPKFAVVSAKVGSISDNRLGGWYSYRASKAALNMFLKTMSIEWQRTLKNGVVLALHPGTADTALSEPFQANAPEGKLFTPERVASDLMGQIAKAAPQDSGAFLTYDGERLPW